MNILFIAHGNFRSNSSIHIFGLASALVRLGCDCCVAIPDDKESVSIVGSPLFTVVLHDDLKTFKNPFANGLNPACIHAWTPREITRQLSEQLRDEWKCKLFVHLEDNEEYLLESYLKQPFDALRQHSDAHLDEIVPKTLSHPLRYRRFLEACDGITVIIDDLKEFAPQGKPVHRLWPGVDPAIFSPDAAPMKLQNDFKPETCLVAYIGNVHFGNWSEVRDLYQAVGLLNQRGFPTKLLRTGANMYDFLEASPALKEHEINFGFLQWNQIPGLLAHAHVLAQPGKDDRFNRYRLPSKLPEYLLMGKPVVLPAANVGRQLVDCGNAVLLYGGGPEEIAACIKAVATRPGLSAWIGANGRDFAQNHFNWDRNAAKLLDFYRAQLEGHSAAGESRAPTVNPEPLKLDSENLDVNELLGLVHARSEGWLADQKAEFERHKQTLELNRQALESQRQALERNQQMLAHQRQAFERLRVAAAKAKSDFLYRVGTARQSKGWRLMRTFRRFRGMALEGKHGGAFGFIKWLFGRVTGSRECAQSFDPFDSADIFTLDAAPPDDSSSKPL